MTASYRQSFDFPIKAQCDARVKIKHQQQAPLLCGALETSVLERNGAIFYFTRHPNENSTFCRYEWIVPFKEYDHGLRIAALLIVSDKTVEKITFVSAWGPDISHNDVNFNEDATNLFKKEIESFLQDFEKILSEKPSDIWTQFFYVKLPIGNFSKKVKNNLITFYSTVKHKNENLSFSVVGIHVKAHFESQANKYAGPIFNKLELLLSLLFAIKVEKIPVNFNEKFSPKETILGKRVKIGELYPQSDYIKLEHPLLTDSSELIEMGLKLVSNNALYEDEIFWNSVSAYVSGLKIQGYYPTLSSVAFITSLAAFSKPKKCNGKLSCTECGDLEFKHNLQGDKISIIEDVKNVLKINSENSEKLEKIIKNVYDKQRSSFVHDAVLRHAEIEKEGMAQLEVYRPQTTAISKEIKFKEDLDSIKGITRQYLLHKLLKFDAEIQKIIDSDIDYLKNWHSTRICCMARLEPGAYLETR